MELGNNDLATAVSLHGLGKMIIWEGDNEKGLKLFEESLKRKPTALCYRNLAVFWNTVPSVTSAPAPTRLSLPITAPFITTAWIPTSEPWPTVQPCSIA